VVTGQLADCQLADWTSRGLDNSRSRRCRQKGKLSTQSRRWHPRVVQSATCPVRELSSPRVDQSARCPVRESSSPRVGVSASCPVTATVNLPTSDETLQQCGDACDHQCGAHDVAHGAPVITDTQDGRHDQRKHHQTTQHCHVVLRKHTHITRNTARWCNG